MYSLKLQQNSTLINSSLQYYIYRQFPTFFPLSITISESNAGRRYDNLYETWHVLYLCNNLGQRGAYSPTMAMIWVSFFTLHITSQL